MLNFITDLAVEARSEYMNKYAPLHGGEIDGVTYAEKREGDVYISTIDILNEAGEHAVGKRRGRYVTISFPDITLAGYEDFTRLCELCAHEIRELCEHVCDKVQSVLLCGLGNERMSPDALGPASVKNVLITRHLKEQDYEVFERAGFFDICAVYPDVSAHTGLEGAELVRAAAERAKPDVIIAVDALAAKEPARLCKTLQLCSAGISPGSGVGNAKNAIDEQSMGVPVISLGVPTVIDAGTLVRDAAGETADTQKLAGLFVCPKDIDELSVKLSKLIGYAINYAFHKDLSFEEMTMM